MNALEYIAFQDRVSANPSACKHGHCMCSDTEGGPCSDEEHANLSEHDRQLVDCDTQEGAS